MPEFTPTAEQQAIVSAAISRTESLMVTAYAGCSKTTTLELVSKALPTDLSTLYVVFNKKNQIEAERRFAKHIVVKTLNGLGHSAWGKAIGKKLTLDDRKLGRLITSVAKEMDVNLPQDAWATVRTLVSTAKTLGVVPEGYPQKSLLSDTEDTWSDIAEAKWLQVDGPEVDVARAVLKVSVAEAFQGTIDFDDQIYMSAMYNGVFARFALVMVDEGQDLNALQHRMVQRSAAGRLIVVGDPKQAIYQFRGADAKSMAKLKALRPEWIDLPLATTFRCPKLIVARHQAHAPGFRAYDLNPEGEFHQLPKPHPDGEVALAWASRTDDTRPSNGHGHERSHANGWSWPDVVSLVNGHTIAVLCRNNAPLLAMAFKLIRVGVAPTMLGRDIGKGLVVLSRKVMPLDDTPASACIRLIGAWRQNELSLALANDQESKASGIEDRAECLLAVLDYAKATSAKELRQCLEDLFSRESGRVTLSTGHRAKGLEYDCVIHLDPFRIPSKYAARDPLQMEQEKNLLYVLETRAKRMLIEANLDQFEIED